MPTLGRVPGNIAVLTTCRGAHDQLLRQVDGLAVGSIPPHLHVVISMGDRDLTRGRLPLGTDRWETVVRPVQADRRSLPLAAARDLAAQTAVAHGAQVLIFLDCTLIPGSRTLERFGEAVEAGMSHSTESQEPPVLWTGRILDLPEPSPTGVAYPMGRLREIARPDPATPVMVPGQRELDQPWSTFTGSAFAIRAQDYERIGGFCDRYVGDGLQDADLAESARQMGARLIRLGGATAYRQPVAGPSLAEQARDALRHSEIWFERWGRTPEHPWLDGLARGGWLSREPGGAVGYRASRTA